ncbi:hypothetical protein FA95DRAFT_696208 [Auriscalpium vulgare]|uniref:Uncharacterized protein n=1 Tax=Auriscalpium vulgare TaxID=40419 RepID=A0ACB8RBP3_9AGAM|nr:hypothetical protein FA95DRAFT_696208 [Auriscalpium vulgare]
MQTPKSSTPASRLPPEMLTTIFAFCPEHHVRIHITHTCHAWRTAALHCQSLWQDIDFAHGHRWAAEILQNRAASIPVMLRLQMRRDTAVEGLALVSQHLGHTRVLRLSGREEMVRWVEDGGLSLPAPLLEVFSFYITFNIGCQLPADVFAGCAPRLRAADHNIISSPIPLSPGVRVFAGLTTFSVTIRDTDRHDGSSVYLVRLLDTLAEMTALKNLHLDWSLPEGSLPDAPGRAAVKLPCLSTLRLAGEFSSCTVLLEHLQFDPQAHLEFTPECTEDGDIAPFFSALGFHLDPNHNGFQGLQLVLEAVRCTDDTISYNLDFHAWNGQDEQPAYPGLIISFNLPRDADTLSREILRGYRNMLPARGCNALRTLSVYSDPRWSVTVDVWQDILEHAPSLQRVYVDDLSFLPFCQVLYRDATSSNDPSHRPRCAPALKSLKLSMPVHATTWQLLFDCLAARGKCGAPVEELHLNDYLNAVVENKLRELVSRVIIESEW